MYNEALLWKNKYDTLNYEHEKAVRIIKNLTADIFKLIEINKICKEKDLNEGFKIELIKNIIKGE